MEFIVASFQKFSLTQALSYAFRTYLKNFIFFAKVFSIAMIGSICMYFAKLFMPALLPQLGLIVPIVQFGWDMVINVLVLKSYDNFKLLRFKDFFNYDFNFSHYALYCAFVYLIQSLPTAIIQFAHSGGAIGFIVSCIGFALCFFLFLEYMLGKYLILDKNLTFLQAVRAIPHLVYGEKLKLLWSFLAICFAVSPVALLGAGISYLVFGSVGQGYIELIAVPIAFAFGYPIPSLIFVSIYKQLIANASEQFNEGLANLVAVNQSENSEQEDDES